MGLPHEVANTRETSFEIADVIIDFTSPKALFAFTESAVASKTGLVIGTTGLEEQHFNLLKQTGNSTRVFYAPNMSFGVNSFFNIARKAASYLKNFDIEIIETHHRYKKDAPSGTAIKLGEEIVEELNLSKDQFNFNRQQNQQERKKDEIGFSSIRGGNIPGEHTVIFHGENESVELTHRAFNREIFADGAIQAAIWLSKQNSGYYTYKDML
jgi:4-hydroxy-tetrahydrodipicolinate reductase